MGIMYTQLPRGATHTMVTAALEVVVHEIQLFEFGGNLWWRHCPEYTFCASWSSCSSEVLSLSPNREQNVPAVHFDKRKKLPSSRIHLIGIVVELRGVRWWRHSYTHCWLRSLCWSTSIKKSARENYQSWVLTWIRCIRGHSVHVCPLSIYTIYSICKRQYQFAPTKATDESTTMGDVAAVYNAMGIELLSKGQHVNALGMFKEAARLIQAAGRNSGRNSFSSCTSTKGPHPTPNTQECDYESDDSSSTFNTSATRSCHPTTCTTLDSKNSFIFCDPMEIGHTDKCQGYTYDAVIVLYNTALTYHLLNVPSHQRENARRHALSLYEMSYNLALHDLGDETSSRIVMVTLNNMAQIEFELGNFQEAHCCLDDLKEYIMSLEKPSSPKIKIERNRLFLNATLLRNLQGAPAA